MIKKRNLAKKNKFRIKKEDKVLVISGRERGKTGIVLEINREKCTIIVEGINKVKKAVKKRRQEDQGGIIEIEAPIHISNVKALTKGGIATRVGYGIRDEKKVRIAKKTGEIL